MVSLERRGQIFVLSIDVSFTIDNVATVHEKLDEIARAEGPKAYIVTGKNKKLFSGGMDLRMIA